MQYSIYSLEELDIFVANFIGQLSKKDDGATIVSLSGELGAGKTALVKSVARTLGIEEDVTSPTFVIQKEYALENQPFQTLIHIDAYRLEGKSELEYLGWNKLISNPDNLIFIEWPSMVEGIALPGAIHLTLEIADNETRLITIP